MSKINEAHDKIIKEEKDKKVQNMAQNLNMAAPPIAPLCEITNLMENLKSDNKNEKMYLITKIFHWVKNIQNKMML